MGDAYPRTAADDLLEEMVVAPRAARAQEPAPACTPMTRRASGSASGRGWARSGRRPRRSPTSDEVQNRLMMAQVLEAVRALEEGVLSDIREGDVGAILGWGFAPWSGGPLSWLDMIGAEARRRRSARSWPRGMARASSRRRCWRRWPPRASASMAGSRRPEAA